jgi:electron transfer flavoprotein beta subunit
VRIVVIQRRSIDVRVPPQRDFRSGRLLPAFEATEVYPPDARALDLALELKRSCAGAELRVLHVGPPEADDWLREARGRGADQVVRLWDDDLARAGERGAALALAAAAEVVGFDLVLLGSAGPEEPAAGLAELVAAELDLSGAGQVLDLEPGREIDRLLLRRALPGGFVERLAVRLPAVLGVAGRGGEEAAPLPALLQAHSEPVPVWDLARVGLPPARLREAERALQAGALHDPRPPLRPVAAPDSSLPAFERIRQLVQGSTERRAGRVARGSGEELAEEIFRTLLAEGWLDHLRPQTAGADG